LTYPQPQQKQTWHAGEPPLWAPYYGAPFAAAVKRFFKKYSTFSGRASRSEYWWWFLVSVAVTTVLEIAMAIGGSRGSRLGATAPEPGIMVGAVLLVIWGIAVIIPSLALAVRRLHDVNFSAWMILIGLVPFVGGLALLVFTLLPPNPAGQRFDQPGGI
jgi:uncharacterized membrane protein YhaH (DUF805 family)